MPESVFIMGATGKVGRELVGQIFSKGDADPSIHRNPTRIVGLASSSGLLFDLNGIDEGLARDFSSKSVSGSAYGGNEGISGIMREAGEQMIIVDATASGSMLELHTNIMRDTGHGIVTANKLPLTESSFEVFEELVRRPQRYGYRCSVMAGAEAVDKLRDMRDLGERPTSITGSFSGTLGYLCF